MNTEDYKNEQLKRIADALEMRNQIEIAKMDALEYQKYRRKERSGKRVI